ncbi:MAG: tandem-95 repeat protein [Pseudodesulfovibrio sp.]
MADTTLSGEQIGSVISQTGSVWAVSGTSQRPLSEGAPVYEGEEIVTESDSNVEIKFADNTILGQGEDSVVQLDDYAYSEDANQLDFNMVKGVMRVVSGEIVKINPEAFNLSTPLATIGIRGTQVMVQVDQGREFIGVDELGEGHTVLIGNAFNEVVIDRAGMFSGVDFDGSLIAPDEMPTNFISTITRAAPLTSLGDAPRNPGDSQEVSPPTSFETIDNQSGEFQPGVGVEVAEEDEEGEEEYAEDAEEEGEEEYEEEFELTEAEIEALLELETAGGTEAGAETEEFDELTDVNYDPFANQTASNQGLGAEQGQGQGQGQDNDPIEGAGESDDTQVEDDPEETPPVEDVVVDQGDAEENAPVSFNVIDEGEDVTLVEAEVTGESEHEGEIVFEPEGTITYTPDPGEDGTVVIDFTVEDPDGEETSAQLSFDLADDSEPVITVTDATGEETEGVMSASGTIDVDFGADSEGSSIELAAENASWDGSTLTADDGSWDVQLTDDGYLFTQNEAMIEAQETDAGEEFTVAVTVSATDSDGDVATGDFSVAITDDGPVASDVTLSQETEDSDISYNVLTGGDASAGLYDGELSSVSLADGSIDPDKLSSSTDGTITYEPAPGETGTVLIDYTITDADGDSASAQLSIELSTDSEPIITVSDATGEVNEVGEMSASGTLSVDFGADDADTTIELSADGATWYDGGSLTALDGSWVINLTDDGYEYTQYGALEGAQDTAAGEELSIDVTVTATDGDGSISTGDLTVTVTDDGPTASDVTFDQGAEDSNVSYNVLSGGDATAGLYDGELTNATLAEGSRAPGSVSYDELGNITYDPIPGETGTVLIDYTVTDADGDTASAQIAFTLDADSAPVITVNDATGEVDDGIMTASGSIGVDFGADSADTAIALSADGATWHSQTGTLLADDSSWAIELNDDGYEYTQFEQLAGAVTTDAGEDLAVDVTVTATDGDGSVTTGDFTVTVTDDGPTAGDATVSQEIEDSDVSYNVLTDDATTGLYDGELTNAVLAEGSTAPGSVSYDELGNITYDPVPGETGTVLIDYTVTDSDGDSASAQLSITLDADSAPEIEVSSASAEVVDGSMTASGTFSVDFGADNTDTTVVLGAIDATWNGSDSLAADDGSWVINLTDDGYEYSQTAAPAGAAATDAGETFSIDVSVTATDGDGSVTPGTFSVTVTDDGPTANDAVVDQEIEDSNVSYNVLTADATTGMYVGGTLSNAVLAERSTAPGSVSYDELGNITYDPVPGETGTVLIDYTVTDSDGDSASAQLSITLDADSAPEIEVTGASGSETGGLATATGTIEVDFGADSAGTIELTSDVADWDSETATLTAEDDSWDIALTADGYVFTQHEAFDHSEGDEYAIDVEVTATDGDGSISTGDFMVLVTDDGPEATDAYMVQEDVEDTISYNVFDEDSATTGTDGGYLVAAELSEGSAYDGDVGFNEDGTITYTPADGETGTVSIDYLVEDGDGDTATAQLSIDLAEPEEEPGEPVNLLVNGDFSDVTADVGGTWIGANADDVDAWNESNPQGHGHHDHGHGRGHDHHGQGYGHGHTNNNSKIEVWQAGFNGVLDPSGSDQGYFVEIDYNGATNYIEQTVTTEIGIAYLMAFEATIRPDSPEGETLIAQVWSGDELIATEVFTPDRYDTNANTGWNSFTLEFTASSDETTVVFTEPEFHDPGNAKNTYGVLLDNVSLTVDPNYDGVDSSTEDETDFNGDYGRLDFVFGTDGDDDIDGSKHGDAIFGDDGDDTINADKKADYVMGGDGDDYIDADHGHDYVMGGLGDDTIIGDKGHDTLIGGDGDDVIDGGKDNDFLIGGSGDDTLTGGKGNDTFVFTSPEDGTDSILDFNTAHDQIAMYEATFDLLSDGNGSLNENQFTTVEDSTYSGGYDFEGATSGLIYASDEGSNVGALFYDPNDTISGDETLLGTVSEDGDDNNITAADIDIV